MKKRLLCLLLPLITLILELLPYGAVCNFANPEGDPWRVTFSYFDPTPFGYANVTPLITAVLTCVILLLLVWYAVTGNLRVGYAARSTTLVTALVSLCPVPMFGISYFSIVGALISLTLLAEACVLRLLGLRRGISRYA